MNPPRLWYFADPMCSWCRGFSPVIETPRGPWREPLDVVRASIDRCLQPDA